MEWFGNPCEPTDSISRFRLLATVGNVFEESKEANAWLPGDCQGV